MDAVPELRLQRAQALEPAAGGNDARSVARETARDRGAEAGRRARHKNDASRTAHGTTDAPTFP